MKLFLIAIGKIKEQWLSTGISQYQLWLKRYTDLTIIEVQGENTPKEPSTEDITRICEREGQKLNNEIPPGSYIFALDRKGTHFSSKDFSNELQRLSIKGEAKIAFIIGGPFGLPCNLLMSADKTVSLSTMTFPHALARLILLEQLYRGLSYAANHPYHK